MSDCVCKTFTQKRHMTPKRMSGDLAGQGSLRDSSNPIKLLHLAIGESVRGSIAPQQRLLTENRLVGTLRITKGTPMAI